MVERNRIVNILMAEQVETKRGPKIEHNLAVAIFDLLEGNFFSPKSGELGPFILTLGSNDNRLKITVMDEESEYLFDFLISFSNFRSIVKDYFLICDSYYDAIKFANPSRLQSIDMARRSLHDEGSEIFIKSVSKFIDLDFETARQFFTIICIIVERK